MVSDIQFLYFVLFLQKQYSRLCQTAFSLIYIYFILYKLPFSQQGRAISCYSTQILSVFNKGRQIFSNFLNKGGHLKQNKN